MKAQIINIILLGNILNLCFATESTSVRPLASVVPYSFQTYVDTKNCTAPIQSSPYIIVLGNGGANMRLSCPAEYPVMYSWRQEVGFGGIISVQGGGGQSWITCCAVQHKWVPTAKA